MPKYRIAGIDRETGLHTRLIIEADTVEGAFMKASYKNVVNPVLEGEHPESVNANPNANPTPTSAPEETNQLADFGFAGTITQFDIDYQSPAYKTWRRKQINMIAEGVCMGIWLYVLTAIALGAVLSGFFLSAVTSR